LLGGGNGGFLPEASTCQVDKSKTSANNGGIKFFACCFNHSPMLLSVNLEVMLPAAIFLSPKLEVITLTEVGAIHELPLLRVRKTVLCAAFCR
jgi:hypothetical protein